MAKGNLKDAYYFSHDSNARNDNKILAMRSEYGLEGYAMYFMIVEILREQTDYRLKVDKYIYGALAVQLQCEKEDLKKFLDDCVNEFELFSIENELLYSESLLRRMEQVERISKKCSDAASKRWEKQREESGNDANGMHEHSGSTADDIHEQSNKKKRNESKGNESKLNEIKPKEIKHIIPPTLEYVSEYCKERKNGIDPEVFIDWNASKGWMIGKDKMKDWQAAVRTWEKRNGFKYQENMEQPTHPQETQSRFDSLTEEETQYYYGKGAFYLEDGEESIDFGELTAEERKYLQEKGVI